MISQAAIKTLAVRLQTTELNIRREYVQHLFLSYFYQQPQTQTIYFKGGTALRLVFGSPRFSEDLDFSTSLYNLKPLEDALVGALEEIEREGIKTAIVESKKTTGGYLSFLEFTWEGNKVSLELNVSRRQKNLSGQVISVINDFVPPYTLTILSENELVQEKILALRTREKPRDFFDLYFLLRKNMLTPKEITPLTPIRKTLETSRLNFEGELKIFLPKSHWPIIRDFKENLQREIKRLI